MTLRVYKYPTGDEIPPGSRYLSTQVETRESTTSRISPDLATAEKVTKNVLVWHYFLVSV